MLDGTMHLKTTPSSKFSILLKRSLRKAKASEGQQVFTVGPYFYGVKQLELYCYFPVDGVLVHCFLQEHNVCDDFGQRLSRDCLIQC